MEAKSKDLINLARSMESGLASGRDWVSVMEWTSQNDSNEYFRRKLSNLVLSIQYDGAETALMNEKEKSKSTEWSIFCELLKQVHLGGLHASQIFSNYAYVLRSLDQLKRKQKSLLAVPKLQTVFAFLMGLFISVLLPLFFPNVFPSFWKIGRPLLFVLGIVLLILGSSFVYWLCERPARRYNPSIQLIFFFYMISILIQSGNDFLAAWNRSLKAASFDQKRRDQFYLSPDKAESLEAALKNLRAELSSSWAQVITGLLWSLQSGSDVAKFLKESSDRKLEESVFEWEEEIRRLSFICLIPLGFFVFPVTLFLLMGPQFILLMRHGL